MCHLQMGSLGGSCSQQYRFSMLRCPWQAIRPTAAEVLTRATQLLQVRSALTFGGACVGTSRPTSLIVSVDDLWMQVCHERHAVREEQRTSHANAPSHDNNEGRPLINGAASGGSQNGSQPSHHPSQGSHAAERSPHPSQQLCPHPSQRSQQSTHQSHSESRSSHQSRPDDPSASASLSSSLSSRSPSRGQLPRSQPPSLLPPLTLSSPLAPQGASPSQLPTTEATRNGRLCCACAVLI